MAEKNKKQREADKSENTTADERRQAATPEVQDDASLSESQGEELQGRFDQIGSIVSKGLELVEASISLGINLVNKLGSVVQEQTIDRIDGAGRPYADERGTPYEEPGTEFAPFYQVEQERTREAETPAQINHIVNRLPLFPGSPVKVSFTINNDSASSSKRLRLRVEGFVGEMHGAELNGEDFAVKPATKVIAPMDFDKFTLMGAIPQYALSDAYSGWIVVSEEEELRIPVRLVVTA